MQRTRTTPAVAALAAMLAILMAIPLMGSASPTGAAPNALRPDEARTAAVFSAVVPSTEANITWQASVASAPGRSPGALVGSAAAWDPRDGYELLFGGNGSHGPVDATWTFAEGGWTNRTNASSAPPAMFGASMDFDYELDAVVLFGGCGPSQCPSSSTWLYAGGNWVNYTNRSIDQPPARFDGSLAFANDSQDRASVLYGGCLNSRCTQRANDTWLLNTTVGWVPESLAPSPPSESGASFTYDPGVRGLLLFGGCSGSTCLPTNASWLYRSGAWSNLGGTIARPFPPADPSPAATYDSVTEQLWVVAGPLGAAGATWSLGCMGSTCAWTNETASVGGAVLPAQGIALPSESGRLPPVLHGGSGPIGSGAGSSATWVLEVPVGIQAELVPSTAPARTTVQGTANASGGTPPYQFEWTSGSHTASSENATLTFPSPGEYQVEVSAADAYEVQAAVRLSELATGPSVAATASPGTVDVGVPVNFTAAPPVGGSAPYNFTWQWPNGSASYGRSVLEPFPEAGSQTVGILVTDTRGVTNASHLVVDVVARPTVTISSPLPATDVGGTVDLTAGGSGGVGPVTYNWTFSGGPANATGASVQPRFVAAGRYYVDVEATDSLGVTATDGINVTVNPTVGLAVVGASPSGWNLSAPVTNGSSADLEALPQNGTAAFTIRWQLTYPDGVTSNATGAWLNLSIDQVGGYEGTATVTDATGAMSNASFEFEAVAGPTSCTSCTTHSGLRIWEIAGAGAAVLVIVVVLAVVLVRRRRRRILPPTPARPA
jgi:hypothetical protein